jgi:hypothetical protein
MRHALRKNQPMKKSMLRPACLALALLVAAMSPASAEVLLYSERSAAQKWTSTLWQAVKLSGNGDVSLLFTNPSRGLVSITFTAECQVITSPDFSLPTITINIVVDEDVVPITDEDDALCAGSAKGVGGRLSMRSFTVAVNLAAGPHTLRVDAAAGISQGAQLDDITVLVTR